jgi:calcineurin-like phosphoesterase family protein
MSRKNLYFTSDTHFSHFNIITACNRPYKSAEEMNEKLISNWNKTVYKDDEVYHLGDIAFFRSTNGNGLKINPKNLLSKLNGNIIYIAGNHDKNNGLTIKNHRIVLYIAKMFINLIHDPEHGSIEYPLNLCGHVHKKWCVKVFKKGDKHSLFINVGIDQWDYKPVSWQKIYQIYSEYKGGKDVEKLYNTKH